MTPSKEIWLVESPTAFWFSREPVHDLPDDCVVTKMVAAKQEQGEPITWESVLGAVARGWCYEENANKTMDSELAVAIAKEVHALYTTPQPKQEQGEPDKYVMDIECTKCGAQQSGILTVNTTPQQRTWVGLTDGDEIDWEEGGSLRDLVKAIEAKLKEKNNG